MKAISKLCIFLFLIGINANDFSCKATDTQQNLPDTAGQAIYFFGGFVGIASNSFLIVITLLYRETRKPPSDLIILIMMSSLLESIYLLLVGYYELSQNAAPASQRPYCEALGSLSMFGSTGMFLYGVGFALAPTIIVNNSLKAKWPIFVKIYFLFGSLFCISYVAYGLATKSINGTITGGCFITGYGIFETIISWIALILYVYLIVHSILKFRRVVPKNEKTRRKRGQYLTFFKSYFAVTIGVNIFELLFEYLLGAACEKEILYGEVWIDINIFFFCLAPICRPFLFALEPRIRNKIELLFNINPQSKVQDNLSLSSSSGNDVLSELTTTVRTSEIYSMICGILLMDIDLKIDCVDIKEERSDTIDSSNDFDETLFGKQSFIETQKFNEKDSHEVGSIRLDDDLVKIRLSPIDGMTSFEMKVDILAPKIFSYIYEQDHPFVNIQDSLNLAKNLSNISKFSKGPDGGKSGEFFFFSSDNMLILKTIGDEELRSIRKRLMTYGNFIYNNPDSLIARIYGVYTFQRIIDGQFRSRKTSLVLMQNASFGVNRECIRRTFDLKGSEFDREVLIKPVSDLSKVTLKDLDFFKTEEKVWIDDDSSRQVRNILERDSKFFKMTQLIDYSLLIMKVDWRLDENTQISDIQKRLPNKNMIIKSVVEDGTYYHIVIIDYLQEWNAKKIMERSTKKLIKLNSTLDTSAQNPQFYAERFYQKLVERIFQEGKI